MMRFKILFFFLFFFFLFPQNLPAVETNNSVTDRFYTGQIQDDTGLYYYNARYYDPQLGIFTSADRSQGPNRYAYVGGNPIMRNDPTGNAMATDDSGGMSLPSLSLWNKFWQNTYEKNRDVIDPLVDAGRAWSSGFQDLAWYEKPAVALGVPIIAGAAVFGTVWMSNLGTVSSYSVSQLQAPSSGLGIVQMPPTLRGSCVERQEVGRGARGVVYRQGQIVQKEYEEYIGSINGGINEENLQREINMMDKYGDGTLLPLYLGRTTKGYNMSYVGDTDVEAVLQGSFKGGVILPRSVLSEARNRLIELHGSGFVHGDINPTNIRLTMEGNIVQKVWLIDPNPFWVSGDRGGVVKAFDLNRFDRFLNDPLFRGQ